MSGLPIIPDNREDTPAKGGAVMRDLLWLAVGVGFWLAVVLGLWTRFMQPMMDAMP